MAYSTRPQSFANSGRSAFRSAGLAKKASLSAQGRDQEDVSNLSRQTRIGRSQRKARNVAKCESRSGDRCDQAIVTEREREIEAGKLRTDEIGQGGDEPVLEDGDDGLAFQAHRLPLLLLPHPSPARSAGVANPIGEL